jgi:N6-L-threonylcarbamoyladenine synthase
VRRVLGIETSCDETAVALIESNDGTIRVAESLVSSQVKIHEPFGGVLPELATREHLRNLPRLVPELLEKAGVELKDIDLIAVTEGPGLAPALLIGNSYARALGIACGKPVYGINHLEGHLFSPFLALDRKPEFPFVGLIASGGHTLLIEAKGWDRYIKLGGTIDDAAGEAFDKVARMLGLSYPGGPEIEKLAREGDAKAHVFPQSFPERDNFNFSFSGLKTSVRYFIEKNPDRQNDRGWRADVCASFQKAVIEVLARKAINAAARTGCQTVSASGGVLCNEALRGALQKAGATQNVEVLLADAKLCTDNAAMIAAVAAEKVGAGIAPKVSADINPNLSLMAG